MRSIKKQYRWTVIIERPEGILFNATSRGSLMLPGGRTKHGEGRLQAAIRELREETGLRAYAAIELFEFEAPPYYEKGFQDFHKVFYVLAVGVPQPMSEAKTVAFVGKGETSVNGRSISVSAK